MLTGPMPAARKALAKAGLTIDDIDLFEVNEAFAAVPMRFMKEMGVPHEKVNVNGGAIAMGHPLGATGAMILNTLVDELHRAPLATQARPGDALRGRRHGHRHHRREESEEKMKTIRYKLDARKRHCHADFRRAWLAGQHHVRAMASRPEPRLRRHARALTSERIQRHRCWPRPRATFFAGADLKGVTASLKAERRARRSYAGVELAEEECFRTHRDAGQAGGRVA